ncbi:glycosyltransferase family 39 protein [Moorella sp. E306M]|uniref:glycosyltransferase family 39 protein n=1 Tax=Moorella sp. E306M TaxID=2572683 RepID=UPI0010FFADD6|nr:glycosyltransferase family 39 protein [Moorella sp. E306M]GEA17100.1 hypothetical protein E306M_02340 [Moorella sp. E306M]
MVFKKDIFRISLVLILLLAGFLCIYAIGNYNGNNAPARSRIGPRDTILAGSNRLADAPAQLPGKQPSPPSPGLRLAPHSGSRVDAGTNGGARYAPQLAAYAIIFFIASIATYYFYIRKKIKILPGNEKILMLALLCAGLLLRIAASTLMEGHPFDINIFKRWATAAASNLLRIYSNAGSVDYPPLYMYVLFLIGKIAGLEAVQPYFTLLLKLPSILADIATSYLIYRLARKYLTLESSVLLAAFYIFNPAVIINSTFWGQVDSFFTFIVVAAVYMLTEKKPGFASALFTAAVMMKPQGIIFLPVLFFELVREKRLSSFLEAVFFALVTAVVIILPFTLQNDVLWIIKLFTNTIGEYPYASVNAFNFFTLIGKNYANDAAPFFIFSYHSWGMIFIVLITALSWYIYTKGNNKTFVPAAVLLQIAGVFTFATRMHERYLFPAAALAILAFIYLRDKRLLLLAAGFSAIIFVNTHLVLFATINGINSAPYSPVVIATSLFNILLVIYLVKVLHEKAVN